MPSWKSLMKIWRSGSGVWSESGSVSQSYGSPDPESYQNVIRNTEKNCFVPKGLRFLFLESVRHPPRSGTVLQIYFFTLASPYVIWILWYKLWTVLFHLRRWEERKRGERIAWSWEGGGELTPGQSGLRRTEDAHRNHARSGNTVPVVRFLLNCRYTGNSVSFQEQNCIFLFLNKLSIHRDAMLQVHAGRKNIQLSIFSSYFSLPNLTTV